MRQNLVITDLTQMPNKDQVCVTGINRFGLCIRPVCDGGFLKQYLYVKNELVVRPGAIIEFDFSVPKIEPPHIEDILFDPSSIVSQGVCTDIEWESVLKNSSNATINEIYGGMIQNSSWVKAGTKTRSIATLRRPKAINVQLREWDGKLKYRMSFQDESNVLFDTPISDLAFRELCFKRVYKENSSLAVVSQELTRLINNSNRVYLRMGLARPWSPTESGELRCYLQITGIYTFPDYLQGKAFDDF